MGGEGGEAEGAPLQTLLKARAAAGAREDGRAYLHITRERRGEGRGA